MITNNSAVDSLKVLNGVTYEYVGFSEFSVYDNSVSHFSTNTASGRVFESQPSLRGKAKEFTLNYLNYNITCKVRSSKSFSNIKHNMGSVNHSATADFYNRANSIVQLMTYYTAENDNNEYLFELLDLSERNMVGVKYNYYELIELGVVNTKQHLTNKHPNLALAVSNKQIIPYRVKLYARHNHNHHTNMVDFTVSNATEGIEVKFTPVNTNTLSNNNSIIIDNVSFLFTDNSVYVPTELNVDFDLPDLSSVFDLDLFNTALNNTITQDNIITNNSESASYNHNNNSFFDPDMTMSSPSSYMNFMDFSDNFRDFALIDNRN